MGCRCFKTSLVSNENNMIVDVPEFNIIQPNENDLNKKDDGSIILPSFINRLGSNFFHSQINVINCEDAKENSIIVNTNNIKCNTLLTKNSLNCDTNNNNNLTDLSKYSNLLNQSYLLSKSDTRGKTFQKSLLYATTLNTSMIQAFAAEMLKEINLIRTCPKSYSDKIKNFMKFIKTDKEKNRKYFLVNRNTKINLLKGEEAFLECLEFIDEFDKKLKESNKVLRTLEFKEELKFPFPTINPEKCVNKEYIKENLLNLKKEMEGNFRLKGFHYDLSTNNPEISTMLQLVDDNNSGKKRRSVLLDEKIKYVGINIGKLKENLYCIYLVFAD